jgi:phosphopantothenoylcysteine decarboxylase/phosphopantothenate--cysteine ligase
MRHPSEDIRGITGNELAGKTIVLGVTGSIAAVETIKLARELIRHGAEVIPVMSPEACKIIHPYSLEFACGVKPITELTGAVEHVALLGEGPGRAHALLVAPATANTISKIALGIDDTPVTTMATTALGTGIPVLVSPAMHASMERHVAVKNNIEKLRSMGVLIIEPLRDEHKAKIASNEAILNAVIRAVGKNRLARKRALVIYGPTREPIDDVRVLTNRSSGATELALALALYREGAEVEVWGSKHAECPQFIKSTMFDSVWDLHRMVEKKNLVQQGNFDAVFVPAAIADYTTSPTPGKLSSEKELTIELKRAPKILPLISAKFDGVLVGFKAESGLSNADLLDTAFHRLKDYKLDFIVANDVRKVESNTTEVYIIDVKKHVVPFKGRKQDAARRIVEEVFGLE